MQTSSLYPSSIFFFFNDTATTEIYTLSLHDALPIYDLAAWTGLAHLHEADPDQIEAVGGIALPEDDLTGLERDQRDAVAQVVDEVLADVGEHRHAAQVRGQGPLAVAPLQLGLERAVLLQHVEHVPQHLEDLGVLEGPDRRGSRIHRQAGHLAEQLVASELGDRIVVLEGHRRVDRDEAMTARLARVLVAADQSAEALEDPGERRPPRAPATLDVGQGAGDRDFHPSAHDVERRRAVLALPADDVARA